VTQDNAGGHLRILGHVQVGAANACSRHLKDHLIGRGNRIAHRLDHKRLADLMEHRRAHQAAPLSM